MRLFQLMTNNVRLVNLTPHLIRVLAVKEYGAVVELLSLPAQGLARCEEKTQKDLEIEIGKDRINIYRFTRMLIVGLPEPEPDTFYIVSSVVAEQAKKNGRIDDVVIPFRLVREPRTGHVIGCEAFARY